MKTFKEYLKKIFTFPIKIEILDGYRYKVKAPQTLIFEDGGRVLKRINKNKRIKSFNGWFLCDDLYYKFAIVEFVKKDV